MRLTYSGRSRPSAMAIAAESESISAVRSRFGDVNWGRYRANTKLNPDISNSTNKRVMRELFREHGVPMPNLYGRGTILTHDGEGRLLKPVVGRPNIHMKGRGFWLCKTIQDVERALRGTRKKRAATHFMEYVEADREYRVHIFKGRSIRISEKGFMDDSKKQYITRKPDRPVRKLREAAKQAVAAVGLDFGAVDILARGEGNTEVWVLEVNAAPGLGGSMPALYAEAFRKWEQGLW